MTTPARTPLALAAALLATALATSACSEGPNLPAAPPPLQGASSAVAHPGAVVDVEYESFEPAVVTVHAGQAVEWVFKDQPDAVNVVFLRYAPLGTALPSPFASPPASPGTGTSAASASATGAALDEPAPFESPIELTGTYVHTFTVPGIYYYDCSLHAATMRGVVRVLPAG